MARRQAFAHRGGGPGIDFLILRVADRKAQRRNIRAIGCAVADLALDDEDPFAVMPLSGCGKVVKMDAAKVHR